MTDWITQPWPWYVAGPLIGLMVPLLLIAGNKALGVSTNLKHICASCFPSDIPYFKYDWKKDGGWGLTFLAGILIGGFIAGNLFGNPEPVQIAASTVEALRGLGITDFSGLVPSELFNFANVLTPAGFIIMVIGGFLIGFGTRYANGCTSGQTISGISNLQKASVVATLAFFAGGLITTHLIYPLLF